MTKMLRGRERLKHYDRGYFTDRQIPEIQSWFKKTLRTDQLSAIGYALGIDSYEKILKILGLPSDPRFLPNRTFDVLTKELYRHKKRKPGMIADIGCGRGELIASSFFIGAMCLGFDPSPGAAELVPETLENWTGTDLSYLFFNVGMYPGFANFFAEASIKPSTIIMCESIEHVPEAEFEAAWPVICDILRETHGRFIVVNWIDYYPIPVDRSGYDHVRRIDNRLYDRLSKDAARVIFRKGSHLVLEF